MPPAARPGGAGLLRHRGGRERPPSLPPCLLSFSPSLSPSLLPPLPPSLPPPQEATSPCPPPLPASGVPLGAPGVPHAPCAPPARPSPIGLLPLSPGVVPVLTPAASRPGGSGGTRGARRWRRAPCPVLGLRSGSRGFSGCLGGPVPRPRPCTEHPPVPSPPRAARRWGRELMKTELEKGGKKKKTSAGAEACARDIKAEEKGSKLSVMTFQPLFMCLLMQYPSWRYASLSFQLICWESIGYADYIS